MLQDSGFKTRVNLSSRPALLGTYVLISLHLCIYIYTLHINLCIYFLKPLIIGAQPNREIIKFITNYLDKLLILSVYVTYFKLHN
jgi:hypothetical protein